MTNRERIRSSITAALGVAALALCASGTAGAATLDVPTTANIFGAGHSAPPPDTSTPCMSSAGTEGTLPPSFSFAPGAGQVLTFQSVIGLTHWGVGDPPTFPPDGDPGLGTSVASTLGISGIDDSTTRFALTGVFLDNSEPTNPAPARLNTTNHAFTSVSPLLEQSFFIGDGLTGNGSGTTQQFNVPAGATRLFLGFQDGFNHTGAPGCYHQNSGDPDATFTIAGPPPTPPPAGSTPPAPTPSTATKRCKKKKAKKGAVAAKKKGCKKKKKK